MQNVQTTTYCIGRGLVVKCFASVASLQLHSTVSRRFGQVVFSRLWTVVNGLSVIQLLLFQLTPCQGLKYSKDAAVTGLSSIAVLWTSSLSFGLYLCRYPYTNSAPLGQEAHASGWTFWASCCQKTSDPICSKLFCDWEVGSLKLWRKSKYKLQSYATILEGCIKVCTQGPWNEQFRETSLSHYPPMSMRTGGNVVYFHWWGCWKSSLTRGPSASRLILLSRFFIWSVVDDLLVLAWSLGTNFAIHRRFPCRLISRNMHLIFMCHNSGTCV